MADPVEVVRGILPPGCHAYAESIVAALGGSGEVPEPEYVCDRCHAPKALHALGEGCNQNCGGHVVKNPLWVGEVPAPSIREEIAQSVHRAYEAEKGEVPAEEALKQIAASFENSDEPGARRAAEIAYAGLAEAAYARRVSPGEVPAGPLKLTRDEMEALLPEKPADVSGVSSAHNKLRAALREGSGGGIIFEKHTRHPPFTGEQG